MISSAVPIDWKAQNSRTKMMNTTSGTMMESRASARCWSSNRPLHTIR
jgi:hypothetical protein